MCTVSVVPNAGGFRLVCNRDERYDRPPALTPETQSIGERTATWPVDPSSGGTWIGVNDAGVAAAVLNRYTGPTLLREESQTTRGRIVPSVLAADSLQSALTRAHALDATEFEPFLLVLAQHNRIALLAADGRMLTSAGGAIDRPLMFTASALGDFLVQEPRRRLFESFMDDRASWLAAQSRFHRHQWPERRDISVLMQRADAATVSRTGIDATPDGITLWYESIC
jgi:Transport and Golgi organisation 2